MREELVVERDRSDLGLVDLRRVVDRTAVAEEDRTSDFLVQHDTHLTPEPGHDVHGGDIDDVVTVEALLLVDGGRSGLSLRQTEVLFLLQVARDVAAGAGLLEGDVGVDVADAGERNLSHLGEDLGHPVLVAGDHVRGVGHRLSIREEELDVVDAVALGLDVLQDRLLEGAGMLGILQDVGELAVREDVRALLLGVAVLFENVVGHFGVRSFGGAFGLGRLVAVRVFRFFILIGGHSANEVLHDIPLLVGHAIEHVRDSGAVAFLGGLRGLRRLRRFRSAIGVVLMDERLLGGVDDDLVLTLLAEAVAVLDVHVLDPGFGVGSGQNQRHLPDDSVFHQVSVLLETVGVDGHGRDVLVLNGHPSILSRVGLVEVSVGVDTIGTDLQDRMAEHVVHIAVSVLPHQGDSCTVGLGERIRQNGPPVRTGDVRLSGIATEISRHYFSSHFDGVSDHASFVLTAVVIVDFGRLLRVIGVFSRKVSVSKFIRSRLLRGFQTDHGSSLVRGRDLVTRELVDHVGKVSHRHKLERLPNEENGLPLRPSGLGQELSPELIYDCLGERLNSSVVVVQELLLRCAAFQKSLGDAKVTVKLLSQVIDCREHVVLNRTIELCDSICSIDPGNAILTGTELKFDISSFLLSQLLARLMLDDIRNLDDQVQLLVRNVVIDGVELVQFSNQSLQSRVMLVHDPVQRVRDDSHEGLV